MTISRTLTASVALLLGSLIGISDGAKALDLNGAWATGTRALVTPGAIFEFS